MADLFEQARTGKLDPVYILCSEQPLLIDRAVAAISDAAVPPSLRGFNYDVIETKQTTAARITSAAQTLPMMAQRRLVLVRDLSVMPAAELAKLIPYIESPNPSTVLVAIAPKPDKRIKFYAVADKRKLLRELEPPKQLVPWITAEAKSRGIDIDKAACTRLADVIGKDLARIALAMDQLALYAEGRTIHADDVDDLIADTRERSVFELINALESGSLPAALAAVASLCDQRQSSIGVVVMLARHIRQIAMCHVAREQRIPYDELPRFIGAPPFGVKKLQEQTRHYSPAALQRALAQLSTADRTLKGNGYLTKTLGRELGERVVLEQLVTDILALRT